MDWRRPFRRQVVFASDLKVRRRNGDGVLSGYEFRKPLSSLVGAQPTDGKAVSAWRGRLALGVTAGAGEHGRHVALIPSSVPKQERATDVSFGRGELGGEDAAAYFESGGGIAERGE